MHLEPGNAPTDADVIFAHGMMVWGHYGPWQMVLYTGNRRWDEIVFTLDESLAAMSLESTGLRVDMEKVVPGS